MTPDPVPSPTPPVGESGLSETEQRWVDDAAGHVGAWAAGEDVAFANDVQVLLLIIDRLTASPEPLAPLEGLDEAGERVEAPEGWRVGVLPDGWVVEWPSHLAFPRLVVADDDGERRACPHGANLICRDCGDLRPSPPGERVPEGWTVEWKRLSQTDPRMVPRLVPLADPDEDTGR